MILYPRSILRTEAKLEKAAAIRTGVRRDGAGVGRPVRSRLDETGGAQGVWGGNPSPGKERERSKDSSSSPNSDPPVSTSSSPSGPTAPRGVRDILLRTDDIIFLNKPVGVNVQGPDADSIEANLASLKMSPADDIK